MNAPRWALPLLLISACAAPRSTPDPLEAAPTRYGSEPGWLGEPLSWAKLASIEAWLDRATDPPAGMRAEAHLELAEGRVAFARRDRSALDPAVYARRLAESSTDFSAVLSDPLSSPDQRARASRGLEELRAYAASGGSARTAVVRRGQWQAAAPNPARLTPHSGAWSRITVHHSALPASSLGRGSLASTASQLRSIQRTHMGEERMGDIGYHFLVDPTGRVLEGRSLEWRGAHAGGENNVRNIGVCLLGNFQTERPSSAAVKALAKLVDDLRRRYAIARDRVYGHRELKGTECPGSYLQPWIAAYRRGASGSDAGRGVSVSAARPSAARGGSSRPAKVR